MRGALVRESRIEIAEVYETRGRRRKSGYFRSLFELTGRIKLFVPFKRKKVVIGYEGICKFCKSIFILP